MLDKHGPAAAAALRIPIEFWNAKQRRAVFMEPLSSFTLGELEDIAKHMRETLIGLGGRSVPKPEAPIN